MSVRPPLRWAGSKRRLVPQLIQCLPPAFGRYIEPFAGSACLFFALAPSNALLADLNPDLIDTYRVLTRFPHALASRLARLPPSARTYGRLRRTKPATLPRIDRAVRFFYLNRFAFNALYRTNRRGDFNVPFGNRTGAAPSATDLLAASRCLRSATLACADFEKTLAAATPGDFVYLDPPFLSQTRPAYGEYGYGSFCDADIPRLAAALSALDRRGVYFLLSFKHIDLDPIFKAHWTESTLAVRRQIAARVHHRTTSREMLLSNYGHRAQ